MNEARKADPRGRGSRAWAHGPGFTIRVVDSLEEGFV